MGLAVQSIGVSLAISGSIFDQLGHNIGQLAGQRRRNFRHAIRAEHANAPGAINDLAELQHAGRIPVDRRHPAQLGLHSDHGHGFRPGDRLGQGVQNLFPILLPHALAHGQDRAKGQGLDGHTHTSTTLKATTRTAPQAAIARPSQARATRLVCSAT